jgi:hypothetical protein
LFFFFPQKTLSLIIKGITMKFSILKSRAIGGVLSLAAVWSLGSCTTALDPKINISPNSPTDVPIGIILPSVEGSLAYSLGGDLGRYTSLITQHNRGVDRQHTNLYQFQIQEGDVNNLWNGLYAASLLDLTRLIDKANTLNLPTYRGIGRTLLALALGNTTDVWNNIPYTEAFRGLENSSPRYDPQEQIYGRIQSLLDSAIIDLTGANAGSIVPNATNDFMLAGNRANWARAARTLKARYALHLSKVNRMQAAQNALAALAGGNGIASNAQDLQFNFGSTPTTANPLFQFMSQRNDIRIGNQLFGMLNTLNDPRRAQYYRGTTIEAPPGDFVARIDAPVVFTSFAEAKFIEAEANAILGNADAARAAYLDGITASLTKVGVSAADQTTYLAQTSVTPTAAVTIQQIIEQKYLALFMQAETYVDWRRTGWPVIDPTRAVAGATQAMIPRRFPYPQDERLNNANFPGIVAITERVWWDRP